MQPPPFLVAATGAAADLDGRFEILRVPAGEATVVASMLGFAPARARVVVAEGGAVGRRSGPAQPPPLRRPEQP